MRLRLDSRIAGLCMLVSIASCVTVFEDEDAPSDEAPAISQLQQELVRPSNPVLTLELAGHGKLFDKGWKEIQPSLGLFETWQTAMSEDVFSTTGGKFTKETTALITEGDKLISSAELKAEVKSLLRGVLLWRMLRESPKDLRSAFEWRIDVMNMWLAPKAKVFLSPELLDYLRRSGWLERLLNALPTAYMNSCRDAGVPVPPNWKETGTAWKEQGSLTYNMLAPGALARVFTYWDPSLSGGCVALPRAGGLAGIICQSATTGKACFWDNKLRSDPFESVVDWQGGTELEINKLRDGSNLSQNCTSCHRGNNVFLLTPDDPTWAKLMRGSGFVGGRGTFTTRVNNSSDIREGHFRYVPLSGTPPRPTWINRYDPPACAGTCHEAPTVVPVLGTMPPMCGSTCSTF